VGVANDRVIAGWKGILLFPGFVMILSCVNVPLLRAMDAQNLKLLFNLKRSVTGCSHHQKFPCMDFQGGVRKNTDLHDGFYEFF
jgi:hypothetical protein